MKKLADLIADTSTIPLGIVPIEQGQDGQNHYVLDIEIKVAFFSAHTEYSLWYEGVEYGKVNVEYA